MYICSVFLVKIVDTKSFRHHPSLRCFALLLKNTNRSQTILAFTNMAVEELLHYAISLEPGKSLFLK